MAPKPAVTDYSDAKDFFDQIGQKVHEEAKKFAEQYRSQLKGTLSSARFEDAPEDQQTPSGPCKLNYEYHTNVTEGYNKEYPCETEIVERFSDTQGSECDDSKIRDNYKTSNGKEGACAPYRRLHLCNRNLQNINRYDKINNDTLLADVCLAAKYEGASLIPDHDKYKLDINNSGSQLCTVLARSFADIGDIIRGKDLYLGGNNQRRQQLEEKLKKIFKEIHDKLEGPKDRYNGDEKKNFFKLREDWWTANRETVWKAITCEANGTYFRTTSCGGSKTETNCRCNDNQVPTYFDYVPQYLRWLEEWAEDFCRKKKKFVDMVKTNCGGDGENHKKRYCDRDGFDCTQTIRRIGNYVRGNDCRNCTVWCGRYEKWIDNQKQEFLKQKKKYTNAISSKTRPERNERSSNNYEGYEEHFYKEFERYDKEGKKFLELLNKENECKKLEKYKENEVDFTKTDDDENSNKEGTFYHSKYCDECPLCGVECEKGKECTPRNDNNEKCKIPEDRYKLPDNVKEHNINFLYIGKGSADITKKLEKFCSKNDLSQDEKWKCYYEGSNNNMCKMEKRGTNNVDHEKKMSFDDFFDFWLGRLLNDAAGWRTELTKCLSEDKLKKCEKGCNKNCKCFKKWIEKKEKEWIEVKEQFKDQKDLPGGDYYNTLEGVLECCYFENIKKAYGDLKSIEEMQRIINENKQSPNGTKDVDALDVLFDHELEEAEDCLEIHEDDDFDDDECVEESEKIPNNPCSGTRHRAMVNNVAADMYRAARQQLRSRAGDRKALKGNIQNATINNRGSGSDLAKGEICNIEKKHSNANNEQSKDPCAGKHEGRFNIGEPWETGDFVSKKHKDVYMPPRRQHMCTSNLEKISVDKVTNSTNVNGTFLLEVLHAAKSEAEDIKKKYLEKNDGQNGLTDKKTVCRAMKYSFADIGDIIRGTDMWEQNSDQTQLQNNLEKIFNIIRQKLPSEIQGKYTDKSNKYLNLRKDWWTANRRQVWKAMKCSLPSDIKCGATPYDDYIPQRLRWMTEWAEWFCKAQKKAYEDLETGCGGCMGKIKADKGCTSGDPNCSQCKTACETYEKSIKPWGKQWPQMQKQYTSLYLQAKSPPNNAYLDVDRDYHQMLDFFKELQKAIKNSVSKRPKRATDVNNIDPTLTSPYLTGEGYIHQELGTNVGCNIQREFCYKKNDGKQNEKYALKYPPPEYDVACKCMKREAPPKKPEAPPPPRPPAAEDVNPCQIVEELFKTPQKFKDACDLKYNKGKYYGWRCVPSGGKSGEKGSICVPPRRRKLYIGKIKEWAATVNGTTDKSQVDGGGSESGKANGPSGEAGTSGGGSEGKGEQAKVGPNGDSTESSSTTPALTTSPSPSDRLLAAFVESAAVETFFLWDRYKKLNTKETRDGDGLSLGPGPPVVLPVAQLEGGRAGPPGPIGIAGLEPARQGPMQQGAGLLGLQDGQVDDEIDEEEDGLTWTGARAEGFPKGSPGFPGQPGLSPTLPQRLPQLPISPPTSGPLDANDPSNIQNGNIPPPFLRQMFYTLGDYADIFFGKNDIFIQKITSGSAKDEMSQREEEIKKAIDNHFNSENNKATRVISSGSHSGSTPSPSEKNSGQLRENLWQNFAKDIWHGMICALTYKEKDTETSAKGGDNKPIQDEKVKGALLEKGTPKTQYQYESVTIGGNDTEAFATTDSASGDSTTLDSFVKRPTYFRYLEEWGETFCKKRTEMLENIKKECTQKDDGDKKNCSGYGEDCDDNLSVDPNTFPTFYCSSCSKPCGLYKRWINTKKDEYEKQQKAYKEQKQNCQTQSKGAKEVCEKLEQDAADFLNRLKKGPCSKKDSGGGSEKDKLDFRNPGDTFKPAANCKPCTQFKVNCEKGNCSGGGTQNGCQNNKITPNDIKNSTEILDMVVSDNSGSGFENDLLACGNAHIFNGFRKDEWTCGKVCGYNVCKPKNVNGKNDDGNQIIIIRAFFKIWLEYFLKDYNKIRKKLKPCIENGNGSICINGCVDQWIKLKTAEWDKIKKHYEKYKPENDDNDMKSLVRNFLQELDPQTDLQKAIGHKELTVFEDSDECNGPDNSKSKNGSQKDIIDCLLKNLQNEINKCPSSTSGQTDTPCDENSTLVEDIDTPDDIDTPIETPGVCDTVVKPTPPEPPLTCVEKAAQQLREEAEEKVSKLDSSLKGDGTKFNSECNKVKKNDTASGKDACDFKNTYENSVNNITKTCEGKGKERFIIGQTWNSRYISTIRKDLYIPPRRKDMCINHLKTINGYTATDSNSLLKIIQEAAQDEGDDIIIKLLKQNSCDEHRICDAMKYSFADLGDIIRGRDVLRNGSYQRIQKTLKTVFIKIYSNLKGSKKKKYENDIRNLYELRSDWWDANRKDIWNAMTCNAPKDAKLNKRSEEPDGISTAGSYVSTLENCGYDKDPPDYDYIPQPFRWMQEWSENLCKLLNEEMKQFETDCKDCKNNGSCKDDKTGKKCEKCKKQCENYEKLIDNWKLQFDKYKETYNYFYNNNNNNNNTDNNYNNKYFKKFLEKLKGKCQELNSSDKYLHEASHCTKYKFTNSGNNNKDHYAFYNPPKGYERACECDAPDPLDQCPNNEKNKGACKNLSIENECRNKNLNNDDNWSAHEVKESTGKNEGVLVPPRRRHLCLRNITSNTKSINNKKIFKNELLKSAYTEGYYLWDKYKHDSTRLLDAMRYSFYDYGDIVKGTDLISTINLIDLNKKLNELFKTHDTNDVCNNRDKWWNENKEHVWNAMVCGYQERNGYNSINASWCTLPSEENNTYQFLRWFREWTEHFCATRQKLYDIMVIKCDQAECDPITGKVDLYECTQACRKYENYIFQKKQEYFGQKKKYENEFKDLNNKKEAPDYFRSTFFSKNYDCLHDNFKNNDKWENPYESFNNAEYREKCECKQSVIPTERTEKKTDKDPEESPHKPVPDPGSSPEKPPPNPEVEPLPSDEPLDPTILQTTIPLGIALALTSIAFLFLKKKTKSSVDLLRVLQIPQNDYDMPTLKSKNRYVPYRSGKYRGKRYIYMEGDTSGDEKYSFMSDTTDITSSESEYEEFDINDIYVPGTPKYKTLIEVVLEPSKRDTQNNIQSDDTPSNKFTDNEWNTLKDEFISQYLPNIQPNDYTSGDIPLNTQPNILGDNVDNNIHPTMSHDTLDQKPFIMSIHDRNLLSGEEYNYDMINNIGNNDLYSGKNDSTSGKHGSYSDKNAPYSDNHHPYSGIDLINDALSGDHDIYDEIIKRKENELFGTEHHPKRTNTYSVAKNTYSDPIMNQLDLFHKWLDRHRDMCEKWDENNKGDILNQLKEKWENDNNNSGNIHPSGKLSDIPSGKLSDIPGGNKTLNTDVSIRIDMDTNQEDDTYLDTYPDKYTADNINPNLVGNQNPNQVENINPNLVENINPVDENPTNPNHVQIEMSVKNGEMAKEK
ncbi:erythrocyte membrane protein 1, EMP1 [Plasmodium reichenowi]|uniref:Erythrocyte membrane protein 1, EMP1 n=1 Tax=Plasmodium reichenowi TaxID=5854 RepID=A0A060RVR1_PLARE|nr:erythrocyte membrane protein 1, EMP1 [Plasmodium reichenowi]